MALSDTSSSLQRQRKPQKFQSFSLALSIFLFSMILATTVLAAPCGGGAPCACADTITSSYTMPSGLTCVGDALIIGADNVVLDCNSNVLLGDTTGTGISITGYSNITLRNCIISNFSQALLVSSSSNDIYTNLTARAVIGSSGGSLSSVDNIATLSVPAGYFTSNTAVDLRLVKNNHTASTERGIDNIFGLYDLGTSNPTSVPFTVTFNYTGLYSNESRIAVYGYNGSDWRIMASTPNTINHTSMISLYSLGSVGIAEQKWDVSKFDTTAPTVTLTYSSGVIYANVSDAAQSVTQTEFISDAPQFDVAVDSYSQEMWIPKNAVISSALFNVTNVAGTPSFDINISVYRGGGLSPLSVYNNSISGLSSSTQLTVTNEIRNGVGNCTSSGGTGAFCIFVINVTKTSPGTVGFRALNLGYNYYSGVKIPDKAYNETIASLTGGTWLSLTAGGSGKFYATVPKYANLTSANITLTGGQVGGSWPSNVNLLVGNTLVYTNTTQFSGTETITNLTAAANSYLATCAMDADWNCVIPLTVNTSTDGNLSATISMAQKAQLVLNPRNVTLFSDGRSQVSTSVFGGNYSWVWTTQADFTPLTRSGVDIASSVNNVVLSSSQTSYNYNTTTTPSIRSNTIYKLYYDPANNKIYAGTDIGLGVIDLGANTSIFYNRSGAYDVTNPASITLIGNDPCLNSLTVYKVYFDSSTNKSYVPTGAGLQVINHNTNQSLIYSANKVSNLTYGWNGSMNICIINATSPVYSPTISAIKSGSSPDNTYDIIIVNGLYYIATGYGLTVLDPVANLSYTYINVTGKINTTTNVSQTMNSTPVLAHNQVNDLFYDPGSRLLFVSTGSPTAGGLSVFNTSNINSIYDIKADSTETIYSYTTATTPALLGVQVTSSWYDNETGLLWVHTNSGLNVINLTSNTSYRNFTLYTTPAVGNSNSTLASYLDKVNNILHVVIDGSTVGAKNSSRINLNTNTTTNYTFRGSNGAYGDVVNDSLRSRLFFTSIATGAFIGGVWVVETQYSTSGNISTVLDLGTEIAAKESNRTIGWSQTIPSNTNITVYVHEGNTSSPDGTWTSLINYSTTSSANSAQYATLGLNRYVEWIANLSTTNYLSTPLLSDFQVVTNSSLEPFYLYFEVAKNGTANAMTLTTSVNMSRNLTMDLLNDSSIDWFQGSSPSFLINVVSYLSTCTPSRFSEEGYLCRLPMKFGTNGSALVNVSINVNQTNIPWSYKGGVSSINRSGQLIDDVFDPPATGNGQGNAIFEHKSWYAVQTNDIITFFATDLAGNGAFGSLQLVDNFPTVTLSSPINGYSTITQNVSFVCNATDDFNVSNLTLQVWDPSDILYYNDTRAINSPSTSQGWDVNSIPTGSNYKWNCLAYDNSSQANWSASNRTFSITDSPPNVTLSSPANGYSSTNPNVTFVCNASDYRQVKNLTLQVWDPSGTLYYNDTRVIDAQSTSQGWDLANIPFASSYNWNCLAYDNASQAAWDTNRTFSITLNTNVTSCQALSVANTVYYVQNSVTTSGTCFNVTANNITLDCQRYTITGDGTGVGINATTSTNGYGITVQNCTISNFASDTNTSGADYTAGWGAAYNAGNVVLINSNMTRISAYGGTSVAGGGVGGVGGSVNVTNSNLTFLNNFGGNTAGGANGGNAGAANVQNSNITTINAYGGDTGGMETPGRGGTVTVNNSNINAINAYAGNTFGGGPGGSGGTVTIINSSVAVAKTYVQSCYNCWDAGGVTVIDSVVTDINAYSNGSTSNGRGGNGGAISLTNSNVTSIRAYGGISDTIPGSGGSVNAVSSNISLLGTINLSRGTGVTDGTLTLNNSAIYSSSGAIKFSYTASQNTSLQQIMNISSNLITLDSATYPDYNHSANITLYSPSPAGFPPYKVLRNGVECNSTTSPSCYNFTALNAATTIFNVSGFTNYSIMGLGVGGWSNVIAPPGVFEPYNAALSGTHINTFSIKIVDLNINPNEVITCVVRQSNGALTTLNATGLSLTATNYTLNYTIASGDSIINNPTAGYIPWELKNCTLTNASGTIHSQTINNRIYVHAPVYWSDSEVTRAVTCQGTPEVYFNNTAKCGFSGDTVFALQMRNGNNVEPSCFNNPGTGCSNSYCTGIYFPSCTSPSYFYGYNATSDDPNGYASFTASFSGYSTPVAYTQYVNSSGTFKLRVTQALTGKPFSFTIYNLTNASNVGGATNVYGPNTGAGTLSVTDQGDGTWSVAYYNFGSFTGTLDFTFNVSFTNTSIVQNRSVYLIIAYGTDTNQGSPPYFPVNFSPMFGLRNANEGENSSITTEFGGTCGDRANNDFDYLGAGGSWTNSHDCYDSDCNNLLGDYSQTNEFGGGHTGLCNYGGERNCTDQFDNDYNSLTDCHDTACFHNASAGCPVAEAICNDSVNNDYDYTDSSHPIESNGSRYGVVGTTALTDCKDIDCNGQVGGNASQFCSWGYETSCSDGFNNDALQLADCNVSTLAGATTMPGVSNGEYDCAAYCRANVQATETGVLCDNNKDDDFDAVYVAGYYSGGDNSTYGAGTDCRWLSYNPDEDCNMTTLNSGKRCELGRELTCNDTFDNDFDSYASSAYRPSPGWNSSYYLATFNLIYLARADYDDYDCKAGPLAPATESQNASWCFDSVDNDLDAYYRGSNNIWTLNSSSGVDCNDPDCWGTVNPANASHTCMKYEYNASDPFFQGLSNPGFYCTNSIDDDGDNWKGWPVGGTDCRDPDCNKKFDICTGPCYSTENFAWNSCKDGTDNDYDMPTGMTDCADTDCAGMIGANSGAFCQTAETICNDNFDNNANGLVDCADHSGCDGRQGGTVNGTAVYCTASESNASECFDGFDNDADGQADCYDTGCNAVCGLSTISGVSPVTLPQWTGTTTINSVTNAYIRNYTNKVKKGDWYNITFTDTAASTNAQWTLGTASGARFNKTYFNTATAALSGQSAGNFTLTETANGFIISSNGNSMPSGYNVTFAIRSTSVLASSSYELTYVEESGAKTSLNNYIVHEVVEDTSPAAQSIQVIPNSTGVPYSGTVYMRANISDDTGLGLCIWNVSGPGGITFSPADSTQCRASFSPTLEGDYNITVTPKDYYSNTGTPLVKAYVVNILPTSSSIQINRTVPFYNQSANETVTINATFNVPASDSLGTCQVIVRSDSNTETALDSFAASGTSCYKSGVNISSLSNGKYGMLVRVTETTDSNVVDSDSTAFFACSNVTSGACRYADYNSDNHADVCNTTSFTCGNGVLNTETGEQCDPGPPLQVAGQSCSSIVGSQYIGTLGCSDTCTFNTVGCYIPPPPPLNPLSLTASARCDGENINLTATSQGSPVSSVAIRVSKGAEYLGYVYTGGDGKTTYLAPSGIAATYTFEASKSGYASTTASASTILCPRVMSYLTQSKLLCSKSGTCRAKVYLTLTGTVQTGTAVNVSISSLSSLMGTISAYDRNGNSLTFSRTGDIITIPSTPLDGFTLDSATVVTTAVKQQTEDNLTLTITNTGGDMSVGGLGEMSGSGANAGTSIPDLSFNITDPMYFGKIVRRVLFTPEAGSPSSVSFTYTNFVVKITSSVSIKHALASNEIFIDFTELPPSCAPEGNATTCYSGPGGTSGVGQCHNGTSTCSGGQWGYCAGQVTPQAEVCGNSLDDDCNGQVDETCASCNPGPPPQTRQCYTGPSGTNGTGICINGLQTCPSTGNWSIDSPPCTGQVTPQTEICGDNKDNDCDGQTDEATGQPDACGDGIDGNCNGVIDEGCSFCVQGQNRSCYTGPSGTLGVGACTNGMQTCPSVGFWSSTWPSCNGQVTPSAESCGDSIDNNCNGWVDEGCACIPDSVLACGPQKVGECHSGLQTCGQDGVWGQTCVGAVYPIAEVCDNGKDDNCNGVVDDGCGCTPGTVQVCYTGPAGTDTKGVCHSGNQTCTGGRVWGTCTDEVVPTNETCNLLDDNCNDIIDDNIAQKNCSMGNKGLCALGNQTCVNGAWTGCPTPVNETCTGVDADCDGAVDNGCNCTTGQTAVCGPPTQVGICRFGSQSCESGIWGNCTGAVYPKDELCGNLIDEDCDGSTPSCPECTSDSQCGKGKCIRGTCVAEEIILTRITSGGNYVEPGAFLTKKENQSQLIPISILRTFGIATERSVKTCEIGLSCTTSLDCFDSVCMEGMCACCNVTCFRTSDCCSGYCDSGQCKLPPVMAPFIVKNPSMFSGCSGLIQECLPSEGGCISICNAMTILLAFVAAGTLFAFWRMYKHPVIAIAAAAIPILIAVLTYPFAGIIVAMLMIGLMFAK